MVNSAGIFTDGTSSLFWKETANQYKSMNVVDIVPEDSQTASTYEAKLGMGNQTVTLKFEKNSANQIE